jgi:DNA-binding MarR family transcriptional regulator
VLEVGLTAQGKRVLTACDVAVDAMEANMLQNLNASERKQLMHGLLSCVHALHGGLESVKELEL